MAWFLPFFLFLFDTEHTQDSLQGKIAFLPLCVVLFNGLVHIFSFAVSRLRLGLLRACFPFIRRSLAIGWTRFQSALSFFFLFDVCISFSFFIFLFTILLFLSER